MGAVVEHSQYLQDTFVLWGDYFDETATVLFVSAFRQVGVRIQIVGLAGPTAAGMNHLALGADLTLSDALERATPAICLIVPCSGTILRRFEDDPRLALFLHRVCLPQTRIILKEQNTLASTTFEQLAIAPDNLAIYSASDDLIGFAHDTAQTLASAIWAT